MDSDGWLHPVPKWVRFLECSGKDLWCASEEWGPQGPKGGDGPRYGEGGRLFPFPASSSTGQPVSGGLPVCHMSVSL